MEENGQPHTEESGRPHTEEGGRPHTEEGKSCPCPKTSCPRHGKCDECRAHHVGKKPPYCLRERAKKPKTK